MKGYQTPFIKYLLSIIESVYRDFEERTSNNINSYILFYITFASFYKICSFIK